MSQLNYSENLFFFYEAHSHTRTQHVDTDNNLKNDIIQCNHMCWCLSVSDTIQGVFVLHGFSSSRYLPIRQTDIDF